jgi:hypothetical protein
MKKIVFTLAALTVFTGCGATIGLKPLTFNPQIPTELANNWRVVEVAASSTPWRLASGTYSVAMFEQNQTWQAPATTTVSVSYPYLTTSTPGAIAFSTFTRDLIAKEVAAFLTDAPTTTDEIWSDAGSDLAVSGEITANRPNLITLNLAFSVYYAGAAHPNTYFRTINYDLTKHKNLTTADFFNNELAALSTLQKLIIPEIVANFNQELGDNEASYIKANDEWLVTGTAASSTNYTHSWLGPEGLTVRFEPYQVAPYSFGPPMVTVPTGQHEVKVRLTQVKDGKPQTLDLTVAEAIGQLEKDPSWANLFKSNQVAGAGVNPAKPTGNVATTLRGISSADYRKIRDQVIRGN